MITLAPVRLRLLLALGAISLWAFLAQTAISQESPPAGPAKPVIPEVIELPEEESETDPPKRPIPPDAWDPASALVVVYNKDVPESVALAKYYATRRKIPEDRLIALSCPAAETISRGQYNASIRAPLIRAFTDRKYWALKKADIVGKRELDGIPTVRIIVPVFGVPTRIKRTIDVTEVPKGSGNEASVDSELALLGAFDLDLKGPVKNPYFEEDLPFSEIDAPPMFLVSRLDGPSPDVVERMIDDAIETEKHGLKGFAYFDLAEKGAGYEAGDLWIRTSERLFRSKGFPTVVDPYKERIPAYYPMRDAAIYFGWYTAHVEGPFLNPEFKFAPGAIACHLHSFSAEDLRQSNRHWTGPLLRRGAAASLGNFWEPYLALTVHFDILSARLLKGYTFAEASWMATPALSWMTTTVGDPLYRPFKAALVGPAVGEVPRNESDYALMQRYAQGKPGESPARLKRALVDTASTRHSGLILESAGLLSASGNKYVEAIELFEHASETYTKSPDIIRAHLHIADMLRRSGKSEAAKEKYQFVLDEFSKSVEARAAKELLKRVSGENP